MILSVQRHLSEKIVDIVRTKYGLDSVPPFAVEIAPNRALGDLAATVAFQLARTLRKPPHVIAQELAADAGRIPGVARAVAAPNGYLNLHLDRPSFLIARLRAPAAWDQERSAKTIVEHTAINPNKAAHVGHLRNATLGDTLARVLRLRGTPVEVQNYIDDLGVQVADIVVGFRELEQRTPAGVQHLADTTRFDYYCWDLYSRVTAWYEADAAHLEARAAALQDLEHGHGDTATIGAFIVDRIVRAHLETMARLNITYDLLTYESDILRLKFWARAFEILKAHGAVFRRESGRLAGCWVMHIDEGQVGRVGQVGRAGQVSGAGETGQVDDEGEEEQGADTREKVIVRSNGVVTYVGKDIANQLWKLGLLGRDFHYRFFAAQPGGRPLWATTSENGDPQAPSFGAAARTYNVIDSRQLYLQALLSQSLRALGYPQQARESVHVSYEMVALSHATARDLGYEIAPGSQEAQRPFVEVSGRKGLGVKIDDLLDLLVEKASAEVLTRNPELSDDERRRVATQIATAAIRYFMLKYSRGKLIIFDIEEALSFEGETGPYLQYAVVRAKNIFHKLREREGLREGDVVAALDGTPAGELTGERAASNGAPGSVPAAERASLNAAPDGERAGGRVGHDGATEGSHDLWDLVFEASRLDEIVDQVARTLEFSVLAKYAFGLAQRFNAFYHRYPVLAEERIDRKRWRAAGVAYFRAQLTRALDLMGIEVPARM